MNKLLKKSFFLLLTTAALNQAAGQTTINLSFADNDLSNSLAYFQQHALDSEIRKAAVEVQKQCEALPTNDSMASSLIDLERRINDRLNDNLYLNYKPYKWEMLLSLYEKTAGLLRQLPPENESHYYASALYNLAVMIMHYNPIKKHNYDVVALMENAFCIREKLLRNDDPEYLESLYGLAMAHAAKGDWDTALPLVQSAVIGSACKEGKAKTIYAESLLLMATLYTSQHRYHEAANLLEQENAVRKELLGAESPSYALRSYIAGDLTMYTGEYEKSFSYFTRALALTEKTLGTESLQYAFCLYGLGSVYYQLAEYKEALPYFSKSLAIKESLFGKDYIDVALSVHMLAKTYERMGLFAQALPLFQRATSIVKKALDEGKEHAFNYGFSLKNLAGIYQQLHQYEPAYTLLKQAASLTASTTDGDGWFYSMTLQNLSLLFETTHRYDSALFYEGQVLMLQRKKWGEEHTEYATALDQLSELYSKIGRRDTALQLCLQASDIRKRQLSEAHPEYATSLNHLGNLYTSIGLFDSADYFLQKALQVRENVFDLTHPDYIKTVTSLGRLAYNKGEEAKAALYFIQADTLSLQYLKRTNTSLSEQEKINLIGGESNVFDYLPSMLYTSKQRSANVVQQVYATELLLKGMVLDDQQQVLNSIRRGKDGGIAAALYFSWRANRAVLAKQYFLPIGERMASFDSLQNVTNEKEEELSRSYALFGQQKKLQGLTVRHIGRVLKNGETAIEFIRFRYQYPNPTDSILYAAIIVLPGDTSGTFVPLFEERELKQLLRPSAVGNPWAIRKLYSDEKQTLANDLSSSLSRLIWKPLAPYLNQAHTIYFAPTGLLHRVAFAALRTDNNKLLIDEYNLNQVFSTRSLLLAKSSLTKPSSVSLWASAAGKISSLNNVYEQAAAQSNRRSKHMIRLPGTGEEIEFIQMICTKAGVHASVVRGEMATEEEFKKLDGISPEVLHVATHGFSDLKEELLKKNSEGREETMLLANAMLGSSLLMGRKQSFLKADEVPLEKDDNILTAYEIAQMDLSRTKLMVLSACNTALGELRGDEGVLGLQRALKMAGIEQMIISLWKVPDKETAELMRAFYQSLVSGKEPREALRFAQLQLKQKYPPFFWAGFVLVE